MTTRHYLDLGGASDWFNQINFPRGTTNLRSFLRRQMSAVRRIFNLFSVLINQENVESSLKGRGIRELIGGGTGEVQKKNSSKGKLNEKKFLHAN